MTLTRGRTKQTTSLKHRLELDARVARERAITLPLGRERDVLLNRARQDETVLRMWAEWLDSPGLQPPK
jgi:hypothetical protein